MIEKLLEKLEEKTDKIKQKKEYFMIKPTVCVVGKMSAGKSSFLNLLLGKEIFLSRLGETTKSITKIELCDNKLLVSELNKTDFKIKEKISISSIYSEFLSFLNIVDVPGYDASYDEEIKAYLKDGEYDIVLYILDISKGLTKKDKEFLELLQEKEPYVLFILNKIDLSADEDKEDTKDHLNKIKNDIEKIYPKRKILGYVPSSATKFRKNKELVKFLQDIIIIASYVSTFKSNLNIIRNGTIEAINKNMVKVKERDKYYTNFYLNKLYDELYKISNFDIITDSKNVIEKLIENLNFELQNEISKDMETIKKAFNEVINNVRKFINDMSISYIEILNLDLDYDFGQEYLVSDFSRFTIGQTDYSEEILDEIFNGIMVSIGGGILARLALGALIPGIGTLVFLGSLVYTFMNLGKKADEIRSKVYNEVSYRLPSIITSSWESVCGDIEKNFIEQIDSITKSKDIDEFLNKLISGAYNMNEELSSVIIDNMDKLCK
ncbi:dynamin family protein [Sulfurihydrogenibium subterraneum]|uniref:dynamin family protein n=1 Tax=Sulfurihydrogenibium subterraneum TaxID=171121 RepID=UPI00048BE10C|nr:dynamin family protein [Sulfurihydrogenibium subterraneum]